MATPLPNIITLWHLFDVPLHRWERSSSSPLNIPRCIYIIHFTHFVSIVWTNVYHFSNLTQQLVQRDNKVWTQKKKPFWFQTENSHSPLNNLLQSFFFWGINPFWRAEQRSTIFSYQGIKGVWGFPTSHQSIYFGSSR